MLKNLNGLVSPKRKDELKTILKKIPPSGMLGATGVELLHFAAKDNNLELLKSLLDDGCDVNGKSSFGTTPIVTAALYDQFEAVKFLMDAKASIWIVNSAGRSPLEVALDKNRKVSKRVIQLFFERLSKCDEFDTDNVMKVLEKLSCPMDLVVRANNAKLTKAMLLRKEPLSEHDSRILVERAIDLNCLEHLEALLHYGIGREARKKIFRGKLSSILQARSKGLRRLKPLLQRLARFDVVDDSLVSLFKDLFEGRDAEVVQLLLECEIDVLVKDKFEVDLLVYLFTNCNADATRLLGNRRINVNARVEYGLSALHLAAARGLEKNVGFLLSKGADPNDMDNEGRTVLQVTEDEKCIEHLLLNGADHRTIISSVDNNLKLIHSKAVLSWLAIVDVQFKKINNNIRRAINANDELKKYYETCYEQIDWMKNTAICGPVTLFSALVDDVEVMAHYVNSQALVTTFVDSCRVHQLHEYYVLLLTKNLNEALAIEVTDTIPYTAVPNCISL